MSRSTFSNCALPESGPRLVVSAVGSPTLVVAAASFAASTASAMRDFGTSIRVGALQDWPVLRKHETAPSFTAAAKFESSRMMLADLPPSSCVTRFTVGAAAVATATPARVEPGTETREMWGGGGGGRGRAWSGERNHGDVGMRGECGADGWAVAVHKIEDTGWHLRLVENLREKISRERGELA